MKAAEQSAKADDAQVKPEETKKLKTRKKQYSNKKSSINKLRDL